MVDAVAGPPEEFDGLSGEAVRELEDLFDVLWCDIDAGILEGFFDGKGRVRGDDFEEGFGFAEWW